MSESEICRQIKKGESCRSKEIPRMLSSRVFFYFFVLDFAPFFADFAFFFAAICFLLLVGTCDGI
jgi:hypothetical protein